MVKDPTKRPFGRTRDGREVDIYTLENGGGMEVRIMTYGGCVVSLTAPDRSGAMADVVLGYDDLEGYLAGTSYFGALIGRCANRIGGAKFPLDGKTIELSRNDGENHLHGGRVGFDKVLWDARPLPGNGEGPALELTFNSRDGEEGYPGNLAVRVVYALTRDNGLKVDYSASTDKPTVVNLTHHSYFNLAGQGEGDVLDHEVMIAADAFTPVNAGLISTGEVRPVRGTPFDFTSPRTIRSRIGSDDEQLKLAGGYDHNYVLRKGKPGELSLAAAVREPRSGRTLEVHTTEPGCQMYTGNFLAGPVAGKKGKLYNRRAGFCLEAQGFPDAPNKPNFPRCTLNPGERYVQTTIYKFTSQ